MAAQNGTAVILYAETTPFAYGKTNSLNINRALIDISNKGSNGWKESIYGQGSASFDFEGIFVEAAEWGYQYAYNMMVNKEVIAVKMSSTNVGDKYYEGYCLITSLKNTAPMEDAQTWSATLEVTGEIYQYDVF